jgi:hypothetical protein
MYTYQICSWDLCLNKVAVTSGLLQICLKVTLREKLHLMHFSAHFLKYFA